MSGTGMVASQRLRREQRQLGQISFGRMAPTGAGQRWPGRISCRHVMWLHREPNTHVAGADLMWQPIDAA